MGRGHSQRKGPEANVYAGEQATSGASQALSRPPLLHCGQPCGEGVGVWSPCRPAPGPCLLSHPSPPSAFLCDHWGHSWTRSHDGLGGSLPLPPRQLLVVPGARSPPHPQYPARGRCPRNTCPTNSCCSLGQMHSRSWRLAHGSCTPGTSPEPNPTPLGTPGQDSCSAHRWGALSPCAHQSSREPYKMGRVLTAPSTNRETEALRGYRAARHVWSCLGTPGLAAERSRRASGHGADVGCV